MKRFFILFLAVFLLAGCGKTAVSADQIRENIIDEVVSYHPGTAGSSLKQAAAAVLEPFFNGDANALKRCAGLFDQTDQAQGRVAVGQKIVDDQHMILGLKVFSETPMVVVVPLV